MKKSNKATTEAVIDLTEAIISKIMSLQGTLEFSSDTTMGIQLRHSNGETTVVIAPKCDQLKQEKLERQIAKSRASGHAG